MFKIGSKRSRLPVVLALSLAMLLGLQGCAQNQTSETVIKLGMLPIEDNLPFYVAEKDQLFQKYGVKVELVEFPSAQEMGSAIQSGQINGEITDMIVSGLLKKGGTDIRIAAIASGTTAKESPFTILASPDSKITKLSDLKNVPIGGTENTIIHYVLDNMLTQAGFNENEIKITSVPKMPVRLEMLLNNQIQAAVFTEPLASLGQLQGARKIADDTENNISQTVILFRQADIESHAKEVTAVLKAYQEAGQAINNTPDQYRELILEKAKVPDALKSTYKIPTFSKLQLPTEDQISKVMQWMVSKQLLPQAYSYQDMVNKDLISDLK